MPEGIQAAGNVSPKRIVKISGNNKVVQASAATDKMFGIAGQRTRYAEITGLSLNDGYHAVSGENCEVFQVGETAPLVAGGAVVAGDRITSDASGKGIATTTDKDSIVGQAVNGAASGEEFMCRINPGTVSV
jgi:hypothetical protein